MREAANIAAFYTSMLRSWAFPFVHKLMQSAARAAMCSNCSRHLSALARSTMMQRVLSLVCR